MSTSIDTNVSERDTFGGVTETFLGEDLIRKGAIEINGGYLRLENGEEGTEIYEPLGREINAKEYVLRRVIPTHEKN